jgi:hypothetical protein
MSKMAMFALMAVVVVVIGCGKNDSGGLPVEATPGEMVLIPAGSFTMGDGAGRPD